MSDVRLKVSSDSLEGLFYSAVEGMNKIIISDAGVSKSSIDELIDISSIDSSMLLIDFLSDVLTLSHKNKCIYEIEKINEISENKIKAVLKKINVKEFAEDIKAVTYTEAEIIKNREGIFETIIVFDI